MKTGSILLVEDNEDDVFFMRRAFKNAEVPCAIQVVEDGQKAIDYLAGTGDFSDRARFELPFLLLLDLKLPFRNGLEVLQWIRQQPGFTSLIVVMFTSSRENSDIEKAYKLGANSFLVKPASVDQLLNTVRSIKTYWIEHNELPLGNKGSREASRVEGRETRA